ncbi:hypothetical protein IKD98_03465 [Candidatus Saccharibacteria bacterium]|nr:hypothetical protein [Candidatus Saccharibacteria bacterium]
MDNKEIYKKTLTFSLRRFLWDLGSIIVILILSVLGFVIADKASNNGMIGLLIGLVIAIILVAIASHFISYVFKAGQIAMMTKGVSEGKLPEDVYGEGKKVVKERFLTVAAYYAATSAIKGIFNQLGRAITSAGQAIGGDTGGSIGSAISSIINTIVRYLCDCCLGWVFYRKDEKATKATLEGAVLFFKHGKTLLKNLGRVFGISLISFVCIGGVFFGITYLICMAFPGAFDALANEVREMIASGELEASNWFAEAGNLMIAVSALGGIVMWEILHSVFVRPFILVGVLRNYIESGKDAKITEKDFDELDGKSAKFKKLHKEAA